MTTRITSPPPDKAARRKFAVGTTGWTADDLDDPEIEREWQRGAYEIVEGVLTQMPAAYHDGTLPLGRLRRMIERHLDRGSLPGEFTHEDDFIVGRRRVARVDMMFMTPEDHRRQIEAHRRRGRLPRLRFGRILVPPTLIVEALSLGHEEHDQETKRQWYGEFGVPNYWLLNPYARSLECLVLDRGSYRVDQHGRDRDEVRPSLFGGLVLPLAELWWDPVDEA